MNNFDVIPDLYYYLNNKTIFRLLLKMKPSAYKVDGDWRDRSDVWRNVNFIYRIFGHTVTKGYSIYCTYMLDGGKYDRTKSSAWIIDKPRLRFNNDDGSRGCRNKLDREANDFENTTVEMYNHDSSEFEKRSAAKYLKETYGLDAFDVCNVEYDIYMDGFVYSENVDAFSKLFIKFWHLKFDHPLFYHKLLEPWTFELDLDRWGRSKVRALSPIWMHKDDRLNLYINHVDRYVYCPECDDYRVLKTVKVHNSSKLTHKNFCSRNHNLGCAVVADYDYSKIKWVIYRIQWIYQNTDHKNISLFCQERGCDKFITYRKLKEDRDDLELKLIRFISQKKMVGKPKHHYKKMKNGIRNTKRRINQIDKRIHELGVDQDCEDAMNPDLSAFNLKCKHMKKCDGHSVFTTEIEDMLLDTIEGKPSYALFADVIDVLCHMGVLNVIRGKDYVEERGRKVVPAINIATVVYHSCNILRRGFVPSWLGGLVERK